jgi:hypothetical protein
MIFVAAVWAAPVSAFWEQAAAFQTTAPAALALAPVLALPAHLPPAAGFFHPAQRLLLRARPAVRLPPVQESPAAVGHHPGLAVCPLPVGAGAAAAARAVPAVPPFQRPPETVPVPLPAARQMQAPAQPAW